ncbi:uncharacterized protein [Clytia hemisphaerica]|uniref:Cnidarian restricted protein n=1 Tax=Clytia hemisphaerica TaxID=252671 RepID=A0A7M5XFR8_9CNID|eukprot:TCONS_00073465-protein
MKTIFGLTILLTVWCYMVNCDSSPAFIKDPNVDFCGTDVNTCDGKTPGIHVTMSYIAVECSAGFTLEKCYYCDFDYKMEGNPKLGYVPKCLAFFEAPSLNAGEDFCKNKYCEGKSAGEFIVSGKEEEEDSEFLVKCTGNCVTERCYYCSLDGFKVNKSKDGQPPECVYEL